MSRLARLEPTAVAPGGMEQLMVKLEEKSTIIGVQLDEPENFEVVRIIAGRTRADVPEGGFPKDFNLTISPPNAFVMVLVKSKSPETKVCGGDLILEGEAQALVATAPGAPPPSPQVASAPSAAGTVTLKCDTRGWPLGGMNEVWVLCGRGEAERLVQAINGYPISSAERPALLRRFQQALGLIK